MAALRAALALAVGSDCRPHALQFQPFDQQFEVGMDVGYGKEK
jgi:hypothetical protein